MLARVLTAVAAALLCGVLSGSIWPAAASSHCGDGVRVSPGDTMARIAQYCGTTVQALLAANPSIRDPGTIYVGQLIRMPSRGAPSVPPPVVSPGPVAARCGDGVRVSPGDTLARIASYCGTTVQALLDANPTIRNAWSIQVGQVIRMPGRGPVDRPPSAPTQCGEWVRVAPGDTLYRIAFRCGTSVSALLAANPRITNPSSLVVGSFVRIQLPTGPVRPPPSTPAPEPGLVRVTGTVTREGVECLAMRSDAGRLYTLSGNTSDLRPGDRIEVTGRSVSVSTCQQGETLLVRNVRQLQPGPSVPVLDVTGTLTREGTTCTSMRGDDGRLYSLAGSTRGYAPGDRVRVIGTRAEFSICQLGITLDVQSIRDAP